jgi:hypothetical protein
LPNASIAAAVSICNACPFLTGEVGEIEGAGGVEQPAPECGESRAFRRAGDFWGHDSAPQDRGGEVGS